MIQSHDQILAENVRVLGDDFGTEFTLLHDEMHWLCILWNQFTQLFDFDERRVELMNRTAPLYFRVSYHAFFEYAILRIARMVDPQESSGHDNLTIRRFSEHISDPAKSKVLAELVAQAITKSEPAIQWRRKHIAHRDLAIALGDSAARLPRLDKSIVEDSVVSLRAVFDWIHFNCFDQRVFHYQDARYPGDALNLLEHLQEGVSSIEERFRRLENGMALPSDYGPRRAP